MRIYRLTFAVCFALSVLFAAFPAFAQGGASLGVEAQKEADGGVKAEVSLTSDAPVAGLQFTVAYDSSLLKLDAANDGTLAGGTYIINGNEEGRVHVVWYGASGEAQTVSEESSVLSLSFTPKGDGVAKVALYDDNMENKTLIIGGDLQEMSSTPVDPDAASASVEVKAPASSAGGSVSGVNSQPYYSYNTAPPRPAPTPALYAEAQLQTSVPVQTPGQTEVPAAAREEDAAAAESGVPAAGREVESGPVYTPPPGESVVPANAFVLVGEETQSAMAAVNSGEEPQAPPEIEILGNDADAAGGSAGFAKPLVIALLAAALLGMFCIWFFKLRKEREE